MKRRNADCGKLRRPIKRNKITEGMYGSTTVLYMKFLILWAIVIVADFMFMFRFEFLWPFWLLLRSVHDSFKYKGLAFSVLFVCIAITSDLVCLFFIPVHWLLFAASTYVWVQYVWHTDKGICLPTIILWMLFVYFEVGIRWKNTRHMPHLDLCRPFAAHCIGYPVVTLGFGFKSYVGYRMRQRKQREVAKENEFYMQLLQQALPEEAHTHLRDISQGMLANGSATAVSAQSGPTNAITAAGVVATPPSSSSSSTAVVPVAATAAAALQANGTLMSSALEHQQLQPQQQQQQQQQQHTHNHHHNNNSQHSSTGNNSNNNSNNSTSSNQHQQQQQQHNNSSNNHTINGGGSSSAAATSPATNTTATTANGHGSSSKGHRRSVDKDRNRGSANNNSGTDANEPKHNSNSSKNHGASDSGKNRSSGEDWEYQAQQANAKEKHHDKKSHGTPNGSVLQFDSDEVVAEHVEKSKGRRNRSKKDNASKDNHHHQQQHNSSSNNNSSGNANNQQSNSHHNTSNSNNSSSHHHHHHNAKEQATSPTAAAAAAANNNNDASSVSSSASSTASSSATSSSASTAISNIATKVVAKICETCLKLEADIKKYRNEISHMKQIENELRQKLDANLTAKSCLQAKQKECDELEKRIHELNNARHADMLNLQNVERRLTEERRQKQSLDAQLANEKKARKAAEEKAARPECSAQCKQRKQQMDEEIKRLRMELKQIEEGKQLAEQHARKFEQELRMLEAKLRTRDSTQPDAEVLMNALAAMQDKNSTLEKNLSAETRVKLDLFSALGVAKRQLEIAENHRRAKEDEVIDLKAKIAQLLAVMPDTLCLNAASAAGAMLRMNDTPPLQTGPGPASPMLSSLSAAAAAVGNTVGHQLNAHVGVVSPTSPQQQVAQDYQQQQHHHQQQQHQQQQHQQQQHQQQQHQQQQHQQQQHQQQQHQQQQHQQQQHQQQQHQQQQHQQQQHQQSQQQQHHQQQQLHQQQQHLQQHQQQQVQVQQQQHVPVSVTGAAVLGGGMQSQTGASTLDPNATIYTPKSGADA